MESASAWKQSLPSHSVNKKGSQYLPEATLRLISLLLPTILRIMVITPIMMPRSKSFGEGGKNNTEKENELDRLSQLNNQLLAQVAALNKEKLTWSTVSGNDTSASNVVEMPLPPAQRRLVHSFIIDEL